MAQISLNENNAFASMSMDEHNIYTQEGLNKREYFAAMAMQGYLSSIPHQAGGHDWIVENSIKIADSLLEKLNK